MTRLEEIAARLNVATEGPLFVSGTGIMVMRPDGSVLCRMFPVATGDDVTRARADAQLFAHAHADLTYLLAELRAATIRLHDQAGQWQKALEAERCPDCKHPRGPVPGDRGDADGGAYTAPRSCTCDCHADVKALKKAHAAFRNLTARIFRDGGHRHDAVGDDAGAGAEAEAVVVKLMGEVERLRSVAEKVAWHRDGVGPDVPVLQERYDALAADQNLQSRRADLAVEACDQARAALDRVSDERDELTAEVERLRAALAQQKAYADAAVGVDKERCAEISRLRSALGRIQGWDCLNPPQADLCADLPWIRRIVDDALEGRRA